MRADVIVDGVVLASRQSATREHGVRSLTDVQEGHLPLLGQIHQRGLAVPSAPGVVMNNARAIQDRSAPLLRR